MKRIVTAVAMVMLILSDQIFKLLALKYLKPIGSLNLIKGFLRLNYVENTGAAFGLFKDNTAVLSLFTTFVVVGCLYYIFVKQFNNKVYNVCLVMIVAGGIGNLIDRIFRQYVVDYIEAVFINFPVFNFADILVTCGSFILAFYLIYETFKERKTVKQGTDKNA